jgi:hypothetical protein
MKRSAVSACTSTVTDGGSVPIGPVHMRACAAPGTVIGWYSGPSSGAEPAVSIHIETWELTPPPREGPFHEKSDEAPSPPTSTRSGIWAPGGTANVTPSNVRGSQPAGSEAVGVSGALGPAVSDAEGPTGAVVSAAVGSAGSVAAGSVVAVAVSLGRATAPFRPADRGSPPAVVQTTTPAATVAAATDRITMRRRWLRSPAVRPGAAAPAGLG